MENKKAIVAIRIIACLGMTVGIVALVFGIVILNAYVNTSYFSNVGSGIKFGADYYTESYTAMAASANNLAAIGRLFERFVEIVKGCFGYLLIVIGLIVLVSYIFKFVKTFQNKQEKIVVDNSQENQIKGE